MFTLDILKGFDKLNKWETYTVVDGNSTRRRRRWGGITLGSDIITLKLNSRVVFKGPIVSKQAILDGGGDYIQLRCVDMSWLYNSDVIEYDRALSPSDMINSILDRTGISGNVTTQYFRNSFNLHFDPAILGSQFRKYPLTGMPAFDAIMEVIKQSGNFLSWLDYDSTGSIYLHCRARRSGEGRRVVLGNYGDNDSKANIVSLTGSESCLDVINRFVGRGDRVMYETTVDNEMAGGGMGLEQDWDSSLNTAALATPGLVYSGTQYANVGRRYTLRGVTDGVDSAGAIYSLAEAIARHRGSDALTKYSEQIQLLYNEPDNFLDWRPYQGNWKIEALPVSTSLPIGGEQLNQGKEVSLVFDAPQAYKTVGTSDTTFTGFRNFMLTLTFKGLTPTGSMYFGRLATDSGKSGNFPVTRTRMLHDNSMKYVQRKSYRANLSSGDGSYSVGYETKVIRDDRYNLRRLCSNYANRNMRSTAAYRIDIKGRYAPDYTWKPGCRIVKIENSDLRNIDWDVVSVVYDFMSNSTTLLTDNITFFREPM